MSLDITVHKDAKRDRAAVLAAKIMDEVPVALGGGAIPADMLALIVLLEGGARPVHEVMTVLGLKVSTAVTLIERAEARELVLRVRLDDPGPKRNRANPSGGDARVTTVALTRKGKRVRANRRGSNAVTNQEGANT